LLCYCTFVCKVPGDTVDWESLFTSAAGEDGVRFHGRVWRYAAERTDRGAERTDAVTASAEEEDNYQGEFNMQVTVLRLEKSSCMHFTHHVHQLDANAASTTLPLTFVLMVVYWVHLSWPIVPLAVFIYPLQREPFVTVGTGIFRGMMPFLWPSQWCRNTERRDSRGIDLWVCRYRSFST